VLKVFNRFLVEKKLGSFREFLVENFWKKLGQTLIECFESLGESSKNSLSCYGYLSPSQMLLKLIKY
jgi:hypothetical protein